MSVPTSNVLCHNRHSIVESRNKFQGANECFRDEGLAEGVLNISQS